MVVYNVQDTLPFIFEPETLEEKPTEYSAWIDGEQLNFC